MLLRSVLVGVAGQFNNWVSAEKAMRGTTPAIKGLQGHCWCFARLTHLTDCRGTMRLLSTSFLLYLTFLLDDLTTSHALRLSLHGSRDSSAPLSGLGRREPMKGDLKNSGDVKYWANVTMGGKTVSLLLDTGSSDLTVGGDVPNAKDTGKKATLKYAIGTSSGPIKTAEVQFEGITVPDQAFVQDTSGEQEPGTGIIGLGPNSASTVHAVLNGPQGDAILDRIFKQNTSTPNYITIMLGRSDDPDDKYPGDLTIGQTIDGYENITSQPKLEVFEVSTGSGQHWQTLTDANGILGPDGQPLNLSSRVKGTAKNRLNTIFDTGFTISQVPKYVADAFYARVPGAKLQNITRGNVGEIYVLPCDVELNVTFKFGGVSFPIHPLDTSFDDLHITDNLGNTMCLGGFQPIAPGAQSSSYDMILGMTFLRNVYLLIDFGDFVDGSTNKNDPYIQLLSSGALLDAHTDFVNNRLDGVDSTDDFHLLPASVLPPVDEEPEDDESLADKIHPYLPYIIAGSVTLGVILILAVFFCIRSGRRKRYRRLHDPAPAGLHHQEAPPFASYQPARRY
ncbi:acid protease [Panus rudis PR-1116 ss-1]|nr:acid protease [Panus rudis PR-1116 ss-1]